MKLTASDLRQIIQEVTQGEMEFSELKLPVKTICKTKTTKLATSSEEWWKNL